MLLLTIPELKSEGLPVFFDAPALVENYRFLVVGNSVRRDLRFIAQQICDAEIVRQVAIACAPQWGNFLMASGDPFTRCHPRVAVFSLPTAKPSEQTMRQYWEKATVEFAITALPVMASCITRDATARIAEDGVNRAR